MHTETRKLHPVPTATEDNPFKLVARYKKAKQIADYIKGLGVTEVSPEPTEEMLAMAAQAAGTHVPSLTTWALVAHLVKEGS